MEQNDGISLHDLFFLLVKNSILIASITILVTLFGVFYTFKIVKPRYESIVEIMVQVKSTKPESNEEEVDLSASLRMIQTVAEFLNKELVLEEALKRTESLLLTGEVRRNLDVRYSTQSMFVTLSYESVDPVFAKVFLDELVASAIDIAQSDFPIISGIMIRMGEAQPAKYVSPNKMLNILISFFLGAVMGVVLALVLNAFKVTLSTKEELELAFPDYPVIGVIPQIKPSQSKQIT